MSGSDSIVAVVEGDITGQDVDVIVNAANAKLLHGSNTVSFSLPYGLNRPRKSDIKFFRSSK